MEDINQKRWYKKKRYIIPLGIASIFIAKGALSTPVATDIKPSINLVEQSAPVTTNTAAIESLSSVNTLVEADQANSTPATNSAPNGTYTNVDGNDIPSPYRAPSKPVGVSAQCNDGSYSSSAHRQGTCSHHGGVAKWY